MKYWLIPTSLLGISLYAAGGFAGRRICGFKFWLALIIGLLAAAPDAVFVAYYFKIWGEPVWLYQFRSLPGSELAADCAGFLAGLLQGGFSQSARFRKMVGNQLFAILLFSSLLGPYLKPLLRPPQWDQFEDRWSGEVCLQTSESSCGPACAATLLRQLGRPATEKQLAREAFTSRHGMENWYLARALRRHGAQVQFQRLANVDQPWPYPAVAGVRVEGTGHFATILSRQGDQYTIGEPLGGQHTQTQAAWREAYQFTGFFLLVK